MDESIEKERSEIPEPAGVVTQGLRIESLPWGKARGLGQNGGFLVAYDETSGTERWLLKVYDVVYDPEMEEDKQDCFIEELVLETPLQLRITDERGRRWLVDLARREVFPT